MWQGTRDRQRQRESERKRENERETEREAEIVLVESNNWLGMLLAAPLGSPADA